MKAHTPTSSASPELEHASKQGVFVHGLPWVVLFFGLLITYALWQGAKQTTAREAREYFDFRVRDAVERTEQRMQLYEEVLRGAQGLFKASAWVERNEFREYVNTLKLADHFPGIQGVGFSLIVRPADKEKHIASIRKEGFPEYTIKPDGKRDIYTSIIYLEPFAERNLRAFGYDMYSEPVRREAMERARDTGQAAMSGKVVLVQETKQDIEPGVLVYLPIYRNGVPHDTLAQRRANLIGWVYSPFRMGDLMRGIYGERGADLDIDIYDGREVTSNALIYDFEKSGHDNLTDGSPLTTIRHLEFGGHVWTLAIESTPSIQLRVDTQTPNITAGVGLGASLLFTFITWMLVSERKRAIRLAQDMNRDLLASEQALRNSEAKLQAILDNAGVAIGWANENGTIEYLNHKFTELFGYTVVDVPTVEHWYQRAYPETVYRESVVSKWQEEIATAREQGTPIAPTELDVTCKDGSKRHAILASAWVGDNILVSLSDITAHKRAEENLKRWANIFEHAEWGIVIGSADGNRIDLANPAFARSHGYTMGELLNLSIAELFAPEARADLPSHIKKAHEKGHHTFESVHLRKDGSTFPVLVDVTSVKDAHGQVLYRIANVQDITERKRAEKALLDSKTILQSILDNLPYMVWLKDVAGRFIAINKPFLASTGKKRSEEVLGKTDFELWPEPLAEKYRADDKEVIALHRQITLEEQALDNGKLIWTETFKAPILDADNELLGITGFARDITERKLDEMKVRHQAHYDALTELPNRILFSDRLQQALAHARRSKEHLAVLFLDLDQFKPVNDTFGHDIGDLLLKEVGVRLHTCIRESDTAARIGGDEFCVLLSSIETEQDAAIVAEKILHALRQPFDLRGIHINIASSIGIAIYPKDGRDEQALIKNADIAMYVAKESGRDNLKFFQPDMRGTDLLNPDEPD